MLSDKILSLTHVHYLQVSLARNKPAIMAASRKVSADHTATDPSQDATHHAPMLNVKAVAGVHHFAGSWLKAKPGKGADRWTEVRFRGTFSCGNSADADVM